MLQQLCYRGVVYFLV